MGPCARVPMMALQVLVVEDLADMRARIAGVVAEVAGCELAAEAASVREALARLAAGGIDICVLDLELPDGAGVAVLGAARRLERPPAVIVFTAVAPARVARRCLALGALACLGKSGGLKPLRAALVRAVACVNESAELGARA